MSLACERAHRAQKLGLFVALRIAARTVRRLHRQQRRHLQQVILHDVAQCADRLVKFSAAFDAELLGHRDLHVRHVVAIPDRLEKRVGEAEIVEVLDRLLAQVMIDAKNHLLAKYLMQRPVQRPRGLEVASERLFDDDARLLGAAHAAERGDDDRKRVGRNRQIVERTRARAERATQRVVGRGIAVIAPDVVEQGSEFRERRVVQQPLLLQTVVHQRAERRSVARRARDGDHRNIQVATARHCEQRRIDLLAREIAGAAEQHQCVGPRGGAHDFAGAERPRHPAVQFKHGHAGETAR